MCVISVSAYVLEIALGLTGYSTPLLGWSLSAVMVVSIVIAVWVFWGEPKPRFMKRSGLYMPDGRLAPPPYKTWKWFSSGIFIGAAIYAAIHISSVWYPAMKSVEKPLVGAFLVVVLFFGVVAMLRKQRQNADASRIQTPKSERRLKRWWRRITGVRLQWPE